MNENAPESPDNDQRDLLDALACLKRVEPSLDARIRCRQVIATELARIEHRGTCSPRRWWRRSISVPAPMALGICTMLLVSLVVRWPMADNAESLTVANSRVAEESIVADPVPTASEALEFEEPLRPTYTTSETYLCGVGLLSYESTYHFSEE